MGYAQTAVEPRLRTRRLRSEPGRAGTWEVVGHPFRLVTVGAGWLLVPVGDWSRRVLVRHDLLARRFRSRTAALRTLGDVLAE